MKRRKRLSAKKVMAHISAYENSEQSISEYCDTHQIRRGTFYNWISRYNVEATSPISNENFVSLTLGCLNNNQETIIAKLIHPNGCSISFYNGCTPELLSQTISQL